MKEEPNQYVSEPFDILRSQLSPELNSGVDVDRQQIAAICLQAGVSKDMLAKLTIELVVEPIITSDGRNSEAEYLTQKHVIRLSVATSVDYMQINLTTLMSMTRDGEHDAKLVKDATELMKQQIQKHLDETIVHELAHFIREAQLEQAILLSLKAKKPRALVLSIMNLVNRRVSLFSPDGILYEEAQTDKLVTDIISQYHPSKLISLPHL